MNEEKLLKKAIRIEAWLEEHFVDQNGVVYTFIDKETLLPAQETLFHDAGPRKCVGDWSVEGFTRSELAAYENCGMCTGAYMQALLYQYRVGHDSKTLEKAQRCFGALKRIFEIGKQSEAGFFPKIYGNRFSYETSTDQVLYTVMAMDHFYEFASSSEKGEIDEMISQMIRFWVKRNYKYTYFHLKDMQWPLVRFPALLLLAYKHSQDITFKKEYERLLSLGFTTEPEWAQLKGKKAGKSEPCEYEKKHNAWLVGNMGDCITMDVMELDYLLANDPGNSLAATWKESVLTMWNEAKITLAPKGKYYSQVLVDMKTSEVRRTPGYQQGDTECHGAESGWSTMVARAAVTAAKYYPKDDGMTAAADNVLNSLDIKDFTYYDEPERFPPELRFKTRFLSGDAITNWLWAYWQGRFQKSW
ncbi:MAG: hypothetical protein WCS96_05440 [Victivallales bacterium]